MCGITLYISKNNNNAVHEVLSSLYELQNRGYDSFGIAYYNEELEQYQTHKKAIDSSEEDTYKVFKNETHQFTSSICMGHSRWATHGKVNTINAHPHISNQKIFYLIHNGIIENYKELKEFLNKKGYSFYSETDSEIIVNLIEYFYLYETEKKSKEAIYKAIELLQGTYGLVILNKEELNIAYLIKKGSPLIISETNDEIIATSELCGLKPHIKNYYELENNELVVLSKENGILFENNDIHHSKEINKEFIEKYFTQDLNQYSHYTQKEIIEQDTTLLMSLNQGARIMQGSICLGGLQCLRQYLPKIQNIIFIGCGSSYYAGCIGYHYIKNISFLHNINVFCFDGGDFNLKQVPHGICLFVFISQSGETMDLIKHLDEIQKKHYTMGIINVIDSTIAKEVNCGIYMNVGKEVAVASTKSFNSSVLLLKLFSLWLYQEKIKTKTTPLLTGIEVLQCNNFIKDETILINQMIYQIKKINHEINVYLEEINMDCLLGEHIFILGKESMEYIAKECALKLKEICYIHGEGLSASSLKHGPLALIHSHFPVILLINHENKDKMLNGYYELKSRNAYIFIITSEQDLLELNKDSKCNVIIVPKNKTCSEILFMLTLQHLCYYLAIRKKIDPDKPKNLAKVVTVE